MFGGGGERVIAGTRLDAEAEVLGGEDFEAASLTRLLVEEGGEAARSTVCADESPPEKGASLDERSPRADGPRARATGL